MKMFIETVLDGVKYDSDTELSKFHTSRRWWSEEANFRAAAQVIAQEGFYNGKLRRWILPHQITNVSLR